MNFDDPTGHCLQPGGDYKINCVPTENANAASNETYYQGQMLSGLANRVTLQANGHPQGVTFSPSTQVETLGAQYQEFEYCVANTQPTGANSAAGICASTSDTYKSIYQYLQQGGSSSALGRTEILGALFCHKLGNCGGPTLSDLAGLVALLPSLLPGGEAVEPEAGPAVGATVDDVLGVATSASEAAAESTINGGATSFLKSGANLVYRSVNSAGEVDYVGMTNNIARRAAEQLLDKGIDINPIPGLSGLSRADALAVEQVLIEE